jgi:octaprenyl-diphosphate synthase
VVIEFIHAATLLHDDVIDKAEERRGNTAANRLWGNEASVLVGDFLYCRSLAMMVEVANMRILQTMAAATTALTEGETMELAMAGDLTVTEEDNLELIVNKTAILIATSARLGAILGEAERDVEEALADYGHHVGIAFQLVDDCLDYVGERQVLGKATYSDLAEGKITLPLIHTLSRCTPAEREEIHRVVQGDMSAEDGGQRIYELIQQYRGIDYAFTRAQVHVQHAKERLDVIRPCSEKDALTGLADYVVTRRL